MLDNLASLCSVRQPRYVGSDGEGGKGRVGVVVSSVMHGSIFTKRYHEARDITYIHLLKSQ